MTDMNINSHTFDESEVRRDQGGRFDIKTQSEPELNLGSAPQPVIINSPVAGDRRANLWVVVPEGQSVEMNVFEAGIGRPEEQTWREDSITFRKTDEGVRAVYDVYDEDISGVYEEAIADLDEETADEMRLALRNEVRVRSYGNTDVAFDGARVEFKHISDHDIDADGGFYTANVFDKLEGDPSYVMTRDGVLFTSAYGVFAEYGYGD